MPFLGLEVILQILCAVHIVKTGRPYYWIYVVIFAPLVGMLVYFAIEVLPDLMGSRTARGAVAGVGRALDPGRAVREAERNLAMTPTTGNKATLADAYLDAGRAEEAATLYRDTLTGVHANDPALMTGLARAEFARGNFADVERVLDALREANPHFQSPECHLLYARSLEEQSKVEAALHEYQALAPYYPGQEARCRYAMLLDKAGDRREAQRQFKEICQSIEMSPRHARRLQREWYDIASRALAT
ncbi:MAG: tetratricopeptide repeat protein [Stellaceae bacterium]